MHGFAEMDDAVGAVGGGGAAGAPSRGAMMDFGVYHPANHDGWHGDGGRLDMHCTGAARRHFPATPMAGGGACGGAAAEEEGRRDEAMARLERLQQRAESPSHLQSSPCSSTLAIPAISHQHVNLAQLHEGTATCTATSPSRGAPSSRGAARGAGGGGVSGRGACGAAGGYSDWDGGQPPQRSHTRELDEVHAEPSIAPAVSVCHRSIIRHGASRRAAGALVPPRGGAAEAGDQARALGLLTGRGRARGGARAARGKAGG